MRVAGIDPDTKRITVAVVDDDGGVSLQHEIAEPPPMKQSRAEHRFLPLMDAFLDLIDGMGGFDYAYVEKPMYTGNPASTIAQSAVLGGIRYALHLKHIPHTVCDPGTWKGDVLSNKRPSKEDIKQWAMTNLNIPDGLAQDVYDAYCIAWHGYRKLPSAVAKGD